VQLVTFLDGRVAVPREFDLDALHVFGATVARVGRALRGFFHPGAGRTLLWDAKHALDLRPLLAEVEDPGRRAAAASALDRFEERVVPMLRRLRAQVIHNDLTFDNVLVDGELRPTAIVDFGDMTHSPLLFDVAVALASFCVEPDLFDRAAAFIEGYERMTPLESAERDLLADAVSARLAANVLISAWRVRRFPDNADYITAFDADTWPALELFDELDDTEVRRRLTGGGRRGDRPAEDLVERRRRAFGPAALPLSYDRPIHMVRAEGVWMFDADGRRYLDAYNNVPVVGHSHPRVVEALATQARELNTNMRYLHETAIELAERLTGTMPAGLDHCVFVNSGSEANELAWRFAKTVTGADGCLVSRWAYHGVTSATFDFSPEDWPQGEGPAYVGTIPPPDGFRGPHRRGAAEWWRPYLEDVRGAVEALPPRGPYEQRGRKDHRERRLDRDGARDVRPNGIGDQRSGAARGRVV
jgi:hypothetical protein